MTYTLTHLKEGWRILRHSLRRKIFGYEKIEGHAEAICRKIVDDCWNGQFIQVSTGHYNQFYSRDFGWCTDALLSLGKRKQMVSTLDYALDKYQKHNGIKVAITPSGKPFNFPNWYSPDSVAYLFRSITKVNDKKLIQKYGSFLEKEAKKFYKTVIDTKTGLVKPKKFSAMKDHAIRKSSCYDTVMVAVMQEACKKLRITAPKHNYENILRKYYWNNDHFLDDLSGKSYISADANIYPFWFNIIKSKDMLSKAIKSMQNLGLDYPFPLHYTKTNAKPKFILAETLVPDWEATSIWPQMGLVYIELLRRINKSKAAKHLNEYKKIIEQNQNFIEVFNVQGKPYKSVLYSANGGMSWASMYLHLIKKKAGI